MFPVTVTVTNPAQLNAVMAALGIDTNVTLPAAAPTPAPEKAKAEPAKKTPAAAAAPTEPAAATQATAPETAAPEQKAESSEPAPACTYDDAAKAIQGLAKTKGRDAAVAVLSSFGVAKLPELTDTSKFGAVVEACNAALKA